MAYFLMNAKITNFKVGYDPQLEDGRFKAEIAFQCEEGCTGLSIPLDVPVYDEERRLVGYTLTDRGGNIIKAIVDIAGVDSVHAVAGQYCRVIMEGERQHAFSSRCVGLMHILNSTWLLPHKYRNGEDNTLVYNGVWNDGESTD